MMRIVTFVLLMSGLFEATAQTKPVYLHMSQQLGDSPFALNTVSSLNNNPDHKISRLQYYLSGFELVHDGGNVTSFSDTYLLVNPASDSVYLIGQVNGNDVTELRFKTGVDAENNHLDPLSWPTDHPLYMQDPSMHWGWAAGYRFMCLEGDAQVSSGNFSDHYEIHSLGDGNYREVILTVEEVITDGAIHLYIKADYNRIYDAINLSGGVFAHAENGIAATAQKNLADLVFTTTFTFTENAPKMAVRMYPNPATGPLTFDFPVIDSDLTLTLQDVHARVIERHTVSKGSTNFVLTQSLAAGSYTCWFSNAKGEILFADQFIVK